jgi:transcriptional regulator with XRE-family HTH domain
MTFDEYLAVNMQDPEFARLYREEQAELDVIYALTDARRSRHLTQKELSIRTGVSQSEISRMENWALSPSIRVLRRLADGMDMTLEVTLKPKDSGRKDAK